MESIGFRGLGLAGVCLRRLRNKSLWPEASECFLSTFVCLQTERPIEVRRPRHGEQVDPVQTVAGDRRQEGSRPWSVFLPTVCPHKMQSRI